MRAAAAGLAAAAVLPVLREGLLSVADAAQHIMVVADAEGRVLWREGSAAVLRKADRLGFERGRGWARGRRRHERRSAPRWSPARPVQVHSAEHFVRTHHAWTCAGGPAHATRATAG